MKGFIILCLVILTHGVFADHKSQPPPLFAPKTGSAFEPHLSKVNLITGEYCDEACDLVVAGCEPISIRRFYNHFSGHQERIYGHWRINQEGFMIYNFEPVDGKETYVGIGERNGSFAVYDQLAGNSFSMSHAKNKGFVNHAFSGKTHPLNRRIHFEKGEITVRRQLDDPEPYCWWTGVIKDGAGGEKKFQTDTMQWPQTSNPRPCHRTHHPASGDITVTYLDYVPPYQARILEEKRPNGNVIRYEYEDCNSGALYPCYDMPTSYMLKSISAWSSAGHPLGRIDIVYYTHCPSDTEIKLFDRIDFKGSDGRLAYHIQPQRVLKKRVQYDTTLAHAYAPGKPLHSYQYQDIRDKKGTYYTTPPYLFAATLPEGRDMELQFDGDKKICCMMAPIGPNGEKCALARYVYQNQKTVVYDAHNEKTIYHYNSENRIHTIERFHGDYLYSTEKNELDGAGDIRKKTLEDSRGQILSKVEYVYDNAHNVIEERIEGASPIFRTYSNDGFNNKLSESDRPDKITSYSYVPGTNLLSSEIVRIKGEIAKRTFHFYDPEMPSVCVKMIIDDGHSEDPYDTRGVAYRYITEILPRKSLPCKGLPEEVREYAGDQLLKKVRYTYHPSGKIASEAHYDGNDQLRYTLENSYDSQERLIATTDPLGNQISYTYDDNFNMTSQTGPRPDQHVAWEYDRANRPIKQMEWQTDGTILVSEQKYDKNSRLISIIDPSGFETRYDYDPLGRLIAVHNPDGGVEKYEYDAGGNLIRQIDPHGYITKKNYNSLGKVTDIYHPDGSEEHFAYNPEGGTLASHVDAKGVKTLYFYDLWDHLVRTETPTAVTTATYSPFHLLSETDPLGTVTTVEYDLVGRKIGEKKGQKETRYYYNALGQLSKIVEGDVITDLAYNLKGELLSKKIEGRFEESYGYDEAGNRISITNCVGTTQTTFNSRAEPISIKDPLGHITEISYSYSGGMTQTIRDPLGITKVTKHDYKKRPLLLQTFDPEGSCIQKEERQYDLTGKQTHSIQFVYEGTTLQKTIRREWFYGPGNRLEKLVEEGGKETGYLYDNLGRLVTLIKPDGRSIHRMYDASSRLSRYYGEGIDYSYTYDAKNRITQIADHIGKTTLECSYDPYDQIISEKLDSGIVIKRAYDPFGRRQSLTLPDSSQVTYTYLGPFIHTISRNGLTHTYTSRNLSGRPTQLTLANKAAMTIEWDPLLRWKSCHSPYFQASYLYDRLGNLLHVESTDFLGPDERNCSYDSLRQLTSENVQAYHYDSLFNRTAKHGARYKINSLLQVTHDGKNPYCYDRNGNLLSDGLHTYEYDLLDRLIAVTTKGNRTTYKYDALNRRISKDNDLYIWDGQHEIGLMRSGKIKELRVLGEGKGAEIGAAVLIELDRTPYIPIHDHRGSVISLVTTSGKTASIYRYNAFGEMTNGDSLSPWRFSSKRYDPESDLLYFGKRYYSPTLGRWLTPDPQGFQDGPNPYAFVSNNPLFYCDPYGLLAKSFSEVHGVRDFCGYLWYNVCRFVEWTCHNFLPVPGLKDVVETTCRWGYTGEFNLHMNYARIHIPEGGIVLPNAGLTYVNGMGTTFEQALAHQDYYSHTHGNVRTKLAYKPTQGLILDLVCCVLAKAGIKMAFDYMLAKDMRSDLSSHPEYELYVYAHSHGGTRFNNSSKLLADEECNRINVKTFGSATICSSKRFKTTNNSVSLIDPVPFTSTWNYIKNVVGIDTNMTFLTPSSKNPLGEHYLMGDTYRQEIIESGKLFKAKYGLD